MRRGIDDCTFYVENYLVLITCLPVNRTALHSISSWMLYTEFCFEVLFLRHLSFMVWISKKQYFIIRNQPCFLFHPMCSNLFLNKLFFYITPNLKIILFCAVADNLSWNFCDFLCVQWLKKPPKPRKQPFRYLRRRYKNLTLLIHI